MAHPISWARKRAFLPLGGCLTGEGFFCASGHQGCACHALHPIFPNLWPHFMTVPYHVLPAAAPTPTLLLERLTVLYIVEHPNQEGDMCIDWTSQYCWTSGWNCLWRGHAVYRNRPLIPLLLEHCTPLMHAPGQYRRDVCPVLKQCHLLAHRWARLSSDIRRCRKHYKAACSNALRLYKQAKHTAHMHARHTSVG